MSLRILLALGLLVALVHAESEPMTDELAEEIAEDVDQDGNSMEIGDESKSDVLTILSKYFSLMLPITFTIKTGYILQLYMFRAFSLFIKIVMRCNIFNSKLLIFKTNCFVKVSYIASYRQNNLHKSLVHVASLAKDKCTRNEDCNNLNFNQYLYNLILIFLNLIFQT